MKYSFIVCAYNVEEYIQDCLESLINQTINNKKFEIIVVNDGSTDKTSAILEKYKTKIRIINQENTGLPEARNVGFTHSQGDWILYVDADDYVSKKLLETIDKQNLADFNFVIYREEKDKRALQLDEDIQKNKMDDSIVCRAIHRDILLNYKFPGQYRYAIEDWDFYVHNIHLLNVLNITDEQDAYYWYRYNEDSLSKAHKVYRSRLEHALSIFENEELRKRNLEYKIIGHFYPHLYMMAKLWFPDLLPRVKKIKFKTKTKFSYQAHYWIIKIGLFNPIIKKAMKVVDH